MFSMILFVLIIILTLGSFSAISMTAPYVLKDFIDFDSNLYVKQFCLNFIGWAHVFNDLVCFDNNLDFMQFWWNFSGSVLCFEGLYWFWFKAKLSAILVKFHWLGLMCSMIVFVLIVILTLSNFGESPMAASYVLKNFIDFD